MLVVPGAAGSNWPPPQGADAVWSKSAGRLLMGDLGPEGNTELRLTSRLHSSPSISPPPSGVPVIPFWTPPSPGAHLSVPSSHVPSAPLPAPPPSRRPLPHMEDRLSWGEVPRHRKLQSSRSGSWKEKGSRDQWGRGAVGLSVPACKWVRDLGPYHTQIPFPRISQPPSSSYICWKALGAPAWKPGPLESKSIDLVSIPFSRQKDSRCLATFRSTSQFFPGSFSYRNLGTVLG